MHRYQHFDDEINLNNIRSSAILPEFDPDEVEQNEDQIGSTTVIRSQSNNFKLICSQRTYLERCLFVVVCLLAIGFAISWIFYQRQRTKIDSICFSAACIELSYEILSSIDENADPCDDFHRFVCGRWSEKRSIPTGYSSWSPFRELEQKNLIQLKNLLGRSFSTEEIAEQSASNFYRSCMNLTELERIQLETFKEFLRVHCNFTLDQWINLNQTEIHQNLFVRLIKSLTIDYDFSYLFPISLNIDEKNSSAYRIHVGQIEIESTENKYFKIFHDSFRSIHRR